MPKSLILDDWLTTDESREKEPLSLLTLDITSIPAPANRRQKRPKVPRTPRVKKAPKKSNLVSNWKKNGRQAKKKQNQQPEIPEHLIKEQAAEEHQQKRRVSKFHPREGEASSLVVDDTGEDEDDQWNDTANILDAEGAKRHNANVLSRRKSSVVLDKHPKPSQATTKPLLDNNKLGMHYDLDGLVKRANELSDKLKRSHTQLITYGSFVPVKDMQRNNYEKKIGSISTVSKNLADLTKDIQKTVQYLIPKACFETRHSRTALGSTIEGLTWDPATLRAYNERKVHLHRTPMARGHLEHEQEANAMLARHIAAIKGEIAYAIETASPIDELCAAQTEIFSIYTETIKTAKIDDSTRAKYTKSLTAVRELMALVVQEKRRKQSEIIKKDQLYLLCTRQY